MNDATPNFYGHAGQSGGRDMCPKCGSYFLLSKRDDTWVFVCDTKRFASGRIIQSNRCKERQELAKLRVVAEHASELKGISDRLDRALKAAGYLPLTPPEEEKDD